jgi:RNA polymerase sigma-70 factor (ECF subfamily)
MTKDFTRLSDAELFYLLNGEPVDKEMAFREIYSRHSTHVYRYCRRILGDKEQCDDIFQETFLRFLQSAQKERLMTNVPAFLIRIARNLCLDENKIYKNRPVSLESWDIGIEDNQYEKAELSKLVAMALDLLSDEFREALVLQVYNDMSYDEIAEVMDVPVTTVRNWLVRAKRKIRQILEPYLEESPKEVKNRESGSKR